MTGNDMDIVQGRLISSQIQDIKKPVDTGDEQELREACQGFEAIFMQKMMEAMRDTLPGDGLFPKSNTVDILESMYDQAVAEDVSKSPGGLGLDEFLYKNLKNSL